MKNIYLLFTIFLYSLLSLETSYSQYSHHIPTLTKPGEGLRGYIIFEPQHQSNAFNISLMKYVNMDNSDSIIAVLLSGHIRLDGTGGDKYLPYSLLIDYSEISTIINWIETIKDEINNNSEIVYLSYSPKDTVSPFILINI